MGQSIRRAHDELYRAWNAHDAAAVAARYAAAVEIVDITSGVISVGRDSVYAVASDRLNAFPDFSLERLMLVADGRASADRWIMRGTQLGEYHGLVATGRTVAIPGATFSEFTGDALIVREAHYVDIPTLINHLGLD